MSDADVFNDPETKAAAERAYPTDDKMSDRTFRQAQYYRLAFRAGADWFEFAHPAPVQEQRGEQ